MSNYDSLDCDRDCEDEDAEAGQTPSSRSRPGSARGCRFPGPLHVGKDYTGNDFTTKKHHWRTVHRRRRPRTKSGKQESSFTTDNIITPVNGNSSGANNTNMDCEIEDTTVQTDRVTATTDARSIRERHPRLWDFPPTRHDESVICTVRPAPHPSDLEGARKEMKMARAVHTFIKDVMPTLALTCKPTKANVSETTCLTIIPELKTTPEMRNTQADLPARRAVDASSDIETSGNEDKGMECEDDDGNTEDDDSEGQHNHHH